MNILFKNKLTRLFYDVRIITSNSDRLFEDIVGYNDIKKLFTMALQADQPVSILLSGPPASAKTLFLQSLMRLQNSYFVDGRNASKAGLTDCIFFNKPRYLLIDEIDKMSAKDQVFLLNLMETGSISETKHRKTRTTQMKISVFSTSNTIQNVM